MTKELLQQCLDALLPHSSSHGNSWRSVEDAAIKAIEQALAQELASQTASANPVVSQKAAGTVDKDCGNCKKFSTNSLTGGPVCISCKDYSNWEPKP